MTVGSDLCAGEAGEEQESFPAEALLATDVTSFGFFREEFDEDFIELEELEGYPEGPQASIFAVDANEEDVDEDKEQAEDDEEIFGDLLKEHGDWLNAEMAT